MADVILISEKNYAHHALLNDNLIRHNGCLLNIHTLTFIHIYPTPPLGQDMTQGQSF